MCTVTLVSKDKKGFVLTSNRDEAIGRETLPISTYEFNDKLLMFPKDKLAGGTWIAASNKQSVVCLLNGGYQNHKKKRRYRHSRGLVVTDILTEGNLSQALQLYNCEDLEPFTLVAVDWTFKLHFYEMVWDGTTKHFRELDTSQVHIWSSSTLYTDEIKGLRRDWLSSFSKEKELSACNLLDFHKNAGEGNDFHDLQIKRDALQTRSITQIQLENDDLQMRYEDLLEEEVYCQSFEPIKI